MRSRPAANSGPVVVRSQPQAQRSQPQAAQRSQPQAQPAESEDSDEMFSLGMVDLGAHSGHTAAPRLDLVSIAPPKKDDEPDEAALEAAEVQKNKARIVEIAGYGPQPRQFYEAVPYFVRVMMRKKALDDELSSLTTLRKRLDQQADEALFSLGEALYALQKDARLKKLVPQLRAVSETRKQMGAKEAEGQKASVENNRELEQLVADIAKVERDAEPLRKRDADAQAKADQLKALIKKKEAAIQKIDEEVKALRTSPDATAVDRITALEAERAAHFGEVQSRNVQLLPLQEDMVALRREIAKRMDTISSLRDEERKITQAMDREQERHRITTGGARGAYKDALKALALAAQKAGLAALSPDAAQNADDAIDRAKVKRKAETLHRTATQSYDQGAYARGMYMLVGGTVLVFVVFAALIVF